MSFFILANPIACIMSRYLNKRPDLRSIIKKSQDLTRDFSMKKYLNYYEIFCLFYSLFDHRAVILASRFALCCYDSCFFEIGLLTGFTQGRAGCENDSWGFDHRCFKSLFSNSPCRAYPITEVTISPKHKIGIGRVVRISVSLSGSNYLDPDNRTVYRHSCT